MSKINNKAIFGNKNTVVVRCGFNPCTKRVEYDTLFLDAFSGVWCPVQRKGKEVFDRSFKMAKRLYGLRITGIR